MHSATSAPIRASHAKADQPWQLLILTTEHEFGQFSASSRDRISTLIRIISYCFDLYAITEMTFEGQSIRLSNRGCYRQSTRELEVLRERPHTAGGDVF
jgi:hypothetical protein